MKCVDCLSLRRSQLLALVLCRVSLLSVVAAMRKYIAILLCLMVSACLSLSNQLNFHISSSGQYSIITLYKSRMGFHTNVHGGSAEVYEFEVPRSIERIEGPTIRVLRWPEEQARIMFSSESQIIVQKSKGLCTLNIELFDTKGKAFFLNGKYTAVEIENGNFKTCE